MQSGPAEPAHADPQPASLAAHAPWIRSLALRLVRDAARADDLVQETLLAALEQRPEPGRTLRPWLRSVLTRRVAFGARSESRRRDRERDAASREELPSSRDLAEDAELHARLVQALARLREPYRTVLLKRYFEGLTPKEIARQLGLPGATVRSHSKRGLAELRQQLVAEQAGDSRELALALIPLAAGAPDAWASMNPFHSLSETVRNMNPIVHVVAASGVALLAGNFLFDFGGPEPTVATAGVALSPEPVLERPRVDAPAALAVPADLTPGRADAARPGAVAEAGSPAEAPPFQEPVVGFVRDFETGVALRGFALDLYLEGDSEHAELLWTDESGRFESEQLYSDGALLTLGLRDHPDLVREFRTARQIRSNGGGAGVSTSRVWHPAEGPLELRAIVGPTFLLAITAPIELGAGDLFGTLEPSVPNADPSHPVSVFRAPVRSHDPDWIRFPSCRGARSEDGPWRLVIQTNDGMWAGEVEVTAADAGKGDAIDVPLFAKARLEVEVVAHGEFSDLRVHAVHLPDGGSRLLRPSGVGALPDGRIGHSFELDALSAGVHSLTVSSEGTEQHAADVTLVAGETGSSVIELSPSAGSARISGELRSVSGQYREPITLVLEGRGGGAPTLRRVAWSEQGVAPFAFDNLPPDDYMLRVYSFSDHFAWDGLPGVMMPPVANLVLTCRDTEPALQITIAASDAETGERIPRASASLSAAGCATPQTAVGGGGRFLFQDVPGEASFGWWAKAEGYVPRFGNEAEMVVSEGNGWIDAALTRGWGARVQFADADTGEPLAGVTLRLDGVASGATDSSGQADLTAPSAPGRVEFELSGWSFAHGEYDSDVSHLDGFGPVFSIALRRDP